MLRINDRDASAYLAQKHGITRTAKTLRKLRTVGGGPQFRKAGRAVLYDIPALDEWAENLLSEPVSSTSETRA